MDSKVPKEVREFPNLPFALQPRPNPGSVWNSLESKQNSSCVANLVNNEALWEQVIEQVMAECFLPGDQDHGRKMMAKALMDCFFRAVKPKPQPSPMPRDIKAVQTEINQVFDNMRGYLDGVLIGLEELIDQLVAQHTEEIEKNLKN